MKKRIALLLVLSLVLTLTSVLGAAVFAEESDKSYYVCFSSESYAIRNSNKMTLSDSGEYLLTDVKIGANEDFFVTDNRGTKYFAMNGDELTTGENGTYSYTVKFSPEKVYTEEKDGYKRTDCHVTFAFYVPGSASVLIDGNATDMSYNSYFTAYDLYYISSVKLGAGSSVSYDTEVHEIQNEGCYRILYTPGEERDGDLYLFNQDGEYGTGEDYKYRLYIEDAPEYYAVFVDGIKTGTPDEIINGEGAYLLTRDESNVLSASYKGARFFSSVCDYTLKYRIYERTPIGSFILIDDDSDDDTTFSKLGISEVGNYDIYFTDGGDNFSTEVERTQYEHDGWYVLGDVNGWGFTEDGEVDLDEDYKLREVLEGDEDYDEDYDQFTITFTVTEKMLEDGDFEFIITDGTDVFMNLTNHINIDKAGKYDLIFSPEHDYGRGRYYRYSLVDGESELIELIIRTPKEYNDFARRCNELADYSRDLVVYLADDIDFEGGELVPITLFNGIFRGGYHTIKNFTLSKNSPDASVFVLVTEDALIERVNVDIKISEKNKDYVGFVGKNYGTLRAISVTGELEGSSYVGGIVAYNGRGSELSGASESAYVNGIVEGCTADVTVKGYSNVGAVSGFNNGEMVKCISRGSVTGRTFSSGATPINIGGISGYSAGRISECENHASVGTSIDCLNVGGIAGQMTGDCYFSYNYGSVYGTKYIGGIVGYYGTVSEDEEDLSDYFGGMTYEEFLAYINDDDGDYEQIDGRTHAIYYAVNEGRVTAKSCVGGIVGYTEYALPLASSVNVGAIYSVGGGYTGGIIGYGDSTTVTGCLCAGSIRAKSSLGANYVGGIAGYGYIITDSMCTSDILGDDYVGGISGYQASTLRRCYSSAVIVTPESARHVGSIAGYAASFSEGRGDFGGTVRDNYYVGKLGGICRIEYGAESDNAARSLSYEELSSEGTLSSVLSRDFAGGDWIGGSAGNVTYPQPKYLNEAVECDYYGDEDEFAAIFEANEERLVGYSNKYTSRSFIITFLEWNKDNGDLTDDDGDVKTSVFDIIHSERIYLDGNCALISPEFVYAENNNGVWIMESDKANYFVSFTLPEGQITENLMIYAEYKEIATTLATEGSSVLVEGQFVKGTEIKLESCERGYVIRFFLDGEEISIKAPYRVKFLTEGEPDAYSVTLTAASGEKKDGEAVSSGRYLSFSIQPGDSFSVYEKDTEGRYEWLIITLSALGGVVLTAAVFTTVILLRKRKMREDK